MAGNSLKDELNPNPDLFPLGGGSSKRGAGTEFAPLRDHVKRHSPNQLLNKVSVVWNNFRKKSAAWFELWNLCFECSSVWKAVLLPSPSNGLPVVLSIAAGIFLGKLPTSLGLTYRMEAGSGILSAVALFLAGFISGISTQGCQAAFVQGNVILHHVLGFVSGGVIGACLDYSYLAACFLGAVTCACSYVMRELGVEMALWLIWVSMGVFMSIGTLPLFLGVFPVTLGIVFGAKGKLAQDRLHIRKNCPEEPLACIHGCGKVSRAKKDVHERKCEHRRVVCMHGCGVELKSKDEKDHHANCGNRVFPCCPLGCGTLSVYRQDLKDHLGVCPARGLFNAPVDQLVSQVCS